MDLDMFALGWVQSLAYVFALTAGLFNITPPKGYRLHQHAGGKHRRRL